ncbi:transcriptional regulator [Lactobacillus nasalidis]|uniref:Transcriptional regulator n=1 Tax=Lactobacillus nasalidis TaxID=2797258 RepID=A0ABQ3W5N8_9LACO|nr:TetR/AcrR family transcriptional regulator [Lactobacillus nasalidis]GHV98303.1 transcriptional regulator [Lactobacillus nasalidis]GHV99486.1 transcriptional regulator [Lactobacillus nasalidis]GHW01865.1 transcriptional regulator [Lactobacillus nasalidis]
MMARRKEIDRERILDIAYKKALSDGIENLTARSIAQTGHFSTQPIYLEFKNMKGLRQEVLKRVSCTLRDEILQKKFIGEPLYDVDLSYLEFARDHRSLFSTIFVNGEFGDQLIRDTLIELGKSKLHEQYQRDFDADLEKRVIALNWIITNGLAVMLVDGLIDYKQDEFVRIIKRQLESLFDKL